MIGGVMADIRCDGRDGRNGHDADGGWRRGECKMPGGKLVAVGIGPAADGDDGTVKARIDGDFFVEGDASAARGLLHELERAIVAYAGELRGMSDGLAVASGMGAEAEALSDLSDRLPAVMGRWPEVTMVGANARTIATAALRAMGADAAAASSPAPQPMTDRQAAAGRQIVAGQSMPNQTVSVPQLPGLIVLRDVPREPAMQLALDQACAEAVAAGRMGPIIRLWQWDRPAVVIGRFQSLANEVDLDQAAAEGVTVVRRITGGGAMFAEPESVITYSLVAPLDVVAGVGIGESYHRCDQWVLDALRSLGIEARYQPINDIASPLGKIGGAAQRRFPPAASADASGAARTAQTAQAPGAVLHHTMLSYNIDAAKMTRILRISREKMSDKAVKSAAKRVDPLRSQTGLARAQVIDRMIGVLTDPAGPYRARLCEPDGTGRTGNAAGLDEAIPPQVIARAEELARDRFSTPEWTAIIP